MSKMVPVLYVADCFACKQHIIDVFNEKEEWVNDYADGPHNIMHHDICTNCTNLAEEIMTKRELQLSCFRYIGLLGRPQCNMCDAAIHNQCNLKGYGVNECCCGEGN